MCVTPSMTPRLPSTRPGNPASSPNQALQLPQMLQARAADGGGGDELRFRSVERPTRPEDGGGKAGQVQAVVPANAALGPLVRGAKMGTRAMCKASERPGAHFDEASYLLQVWELDIPWRIDLRQQCRQDRGQAWVWC